MHLLAEICATLIRQTPSFRGKGRLMHWWMTNCRGREVRSRRIGSSRLQLDLAVPYEAMVWLRQEEEGDLRALRTLLAPEGFFVDVGANIGLWSTVAAETIPGRQVVAFEPNPTTYQKLSTNARGGRRSASIQLFPCALGSSDGEITLHCADDHNVSSILPITAESRTCQVPMRCLDSFLDSWPKVQGMKIDAEGFELAVLEGAQSLLRRDFPWLIIEFNTELAGTARLGDWSVHRLLSSLGYSAVLMPQAIHVTRELDCEVLPEGWSTRGYCNLFYHRSKE